MALRDFLKSIADAIRAKKGTTDTIKATDFPNEIGEVYEAGFNAGKAEGSGGESWYNEFWDGQQDKGERTDYYAGFRGWRSSGFYPKHNIQPDSAYQLFAFFVSNEGEAAIDLVERCKQCGINLDFSKAGSVQYMFWNAQISHVGVIDTRNTNYVDQIFQNNPHIVKVDKIILKESGTQSFRSSFLECSALEEIEIEGIIGQDVDVHWSILLYKSSIISYVNALSATTSGLTLTLSKEAVNKAFETAEGLADGSTSQEWLDLIGTKENWTISLV